MEVQYVKRPRWPEVYGALFFSLAVRAVTPAGRWIGLLLDFVKKLPPKSEGKPHTEAAARQARGYHQWLRAAEKQRAYTSYGIAVAYYRREREDEYRQTFIHHPILHHPAVFVKGLLSSANDILIFFSYNHTRVNHSNVFIRYNKYYMTQNTLL